MSRVMPSLMFLVSARLRTGFPPLVLAHLKPFMSVLNILAPQKDWRLLFFTTNGRKINLLAILPGCRILIGGGLQCFECCSSLSICASVTVGLLEVPAGAVCLSSSQVLAFVAFGQAAVRLEKTPSRQESRSLTRRK